MYKNNRKGINEDKKLESIVINTISKYNLIQNGDKIVVGVSGGPDSICLLDILKNLFLSHSCPIQTRNQWET